MTIIVYQRGDLPRITGAFKNSAGTATDPTGVSFKYKKPSIAAVTLVYLTDNALVKDSTGNYHVDLSITEAGEWYYRWEATGTVQAAEEGQFTVEASAL